MGLAPIQSEAPLPARVRTELTQELERGLARLESDVAGLNVDPQCADPGCFAVSGRQQGMKYVVLPRVELREQDYELGLLLLDAETGATVASLDQTCELCGLAEAGDAIRGLAGTLQAKLDALEIGPALLKIEASPAEALIEIDGEAVGRAPLEQELEEGTHWAVARLDGYGTQRRQVDAVPGVQETVVFELSPLPSDGSSRGHKLELAGWSLLGIGVASIATGALLVGIEERPNRTRCSGSDVDQDGDCRLRYATLEPGIGLLALGGASVVAGTVMAVLGRRRQRRQVAVIVAPRQVGFRGRF